MQLNLLLTLRAPPLSFILAICITALRITGIYPISNPTLKRTASQPLSSNVRKTWKALIQRCICRGDPPFCGALFGMSFLRLSLHFSYLKMLQNAKFWCSIFLPMPGPYSVYQVASLDCWHIGLCTIHPWPKQSPQMTLSNQAVKRTGLRPAAYFVR